MGVIKTGNGEMTEWYSKMCDTVNQVQSLRANHFQVSSIVANRSHVSSFRVLNTPCSDNLYPCTLSAYICIFQNQIHLREPTHCQTNGYWERINPSATKSCLNVHPNSPKRNSKEYVKNSQKSWRFNLVFQEYMTYRKHKYMRLDGSSKISDRRDMVADFQSK